jgi:hypothetical protein
LQGKLEELSSQVVEHGASWSDLVTKIFEKMGEVPGQPRSLCFVELDSKVSDMPFDWYTVIVV